MKIIIDNMKVACYPKGKLIFKKGDVTKKIHVILMGNIGLYDISEYVYGDNEIL